MAFAAALAGALGVARAQTVELPGHLAPAMAALRNTHSAAENRQLKVTVVFALRNQEQLDKLLGDQQDPASPQYQQWLTPDEFDSRFGPSASDYYAVQDWLASQGFSIVGGDIRNRAITATAPVSAVEDAFAVNIVESGDGALFANTVNPSVPMRFASVIGSIDGLDNLHASIAPSLVQPGEAKRVTTQKPLYKNAGHIVAFAPPDLYTFYDETPLLKKGVNGNTKDCIAVVEESNYRDAPVNLFDKTFQIAAPSVTKVLADGTDPGLNVEETGDWIDLEYAHAIAPASPLEVVIGNPNDATASGPIIDALQSAVTSNRCAVITVNFITCGNAASFYTGTFDGIVKKGASQGQSILFPAGDRGAAGFVYDPKQNSCVVASTRNVNEFSADPNVISVGGTEFNPRYNSAGNDVSFVAESAWDEQKVGAAGGGGVSAVFARPSYQKPVNKGAMRDVPDLSMEAASLHPGLFLGDMKNGQAVIDCCWGSTDFSTLMVAGVLKLLEQKTGKRQGNINPYLYAIGGKSNAAALGIRDVKMGGNGFNNVQGFPAVPGYDLCTGWGTLDITKFVNGHP